MSAPIIQAKYEQLEDISKRFETLSESSDDLQNNALRHASDLKNGGWIGRGSSAFFAEMNDEVLPAYGRLGEAFAGASLVIRQIIAVLQEAEELAANQFDVGDGSVPEVVLTTPSIPSDPLHEAVVDTDRIEWRDNFGIEFPTTLRALFDLISDAGGRYSKGVMVLAGAALGGIENTDNDLLQSTTTSGIEGLFPFIHPKVGAALLINSLVHLGGQVGETLDDWQLEILPVSDNLKLVINQSSNEFYANVDRTDLNQVTGPLADIWYDSEFTPYLEARKDHALNPSIMNTLRLRLLEMSGDLFPGPMPGSGIGLLVSPEARQGVLEGYLDLGGGISEITSGAADLPRSALVRIGAINAGYVAAGINVVIPGDWERYVNNAAEVVVIEIDDMSRL